MIGRRLVLVVLASGGLVASSCRPGPGPAPAGEPSSAGPGIDVPAEIPLGRAIPGATARGELVVRATRDVRLISARATCDCTTAEAATPVDLKAGETTTVRVAIDLAKLARGGLPSAATGGPGKQRREIVLETDAGKTSSFAVVEVSDRVALDPPILRFGPTPVGLEIAASVRVGSPTPDTSVHVTSVEPSEPGLSAEVAHDPAGERLDVRWTPRERGSRRARLRLALDSPEDPFVDLEVTADVLAAVVVRPTKIEDLAASTSRPVVVRLQIVRTAGGGMPDLAATSDNNRVLVEVLPGSGHTRNVQVILPVLKAPAETTGNVLIRTGIPDAAELVVPFRVRAAGG